MQDRKIYERSLSDYPDVLTVPDLQRALDGMCDKTIRGILWRGEIFSFIAILFVPSHEVKYLCCKQTAKHVSVRQLLITASGCPSKRVRCIREARPNDKAFLLWMD